MNANASALIALGTNLPYQDISGSALLARAVTQMRAAGLGPRLLSGIWRTDPWPPSAQPVFFNAVAELDPQGRTPQELYAALRTIERAFGRARRQRWGPRTLDLDLIAMAGWIGTFGTLTLPHKRMQERAFVLAPLAEVAPDWRHPISGRSARELLAALAPGQVVRRTGGFAP